MGWGAVTGDCYYARAGVASRLPQCSNKEQRRTSWSSLECYCSRS